MRLYYKELKITAQNKKLI